jgi:pectate lyase
MRETTEYRILLKTTHLHQSFRMIFSKPPCLLLIVFVSLWSIGQVVNAIPAFPGAEGAGANAVGGRGGDLYFVTNTNNTGAGSLRNGISEANGPRTILFRVSGTIDLTSDLSINKPYLTIAGQSAPGDGITLRRRGARISSTHNVIVRFLRFRPGDLDSAFEGDAFWVVRGTNIMIDHVSSSWSVDECLSVTHSTNVTVQWSLISESLNNSQHEKGAHGYGSLLRYGAGELTFHHNLYQHHNSRNPRLGDRIKLDFVNNVIYHWGGRAGYSANDLGDNPGGFTNHLNYVGNYLVAGPSTGPSSQAFLSGATTTVIHQSGNFIDSNKNSVLDGANTGWGMFSSSYTPSDTRYPLPEVATDPAASAYQKVLAFAGASVVRDAVDVRLIGNVQNHGGRLVDAVGAPDQATDYVTNSINGANYVFVRGWPQLNSATPPADSDDDGIPDYFENVFGWNPNVANNNHVNADGYTDLEWYLNWLAAPRAVGGMNPPCAVNLRALTGANTNLAFSSLSSTNGTAMLLSDGYTVEFVPGTNFLGLTSFTFSATNAVDGAGFGPVSVAVLVTNSPPVLAPISDYPVIAGATLTVTNSASDPNQPDDTLAFALAVAPAGASIVPTNGVFSWRPTIAQGGTTNPVSIVVSDNGSPGLNATQSFSVTVSRPAQPQAQVFLNHNSRPTLVVIGDAGPDYAVQASTNMTDWTTIVLTNSPVLPWVWSDEEVISFNERFYRILLGP